ncbi:metalloendoproteinase 5-MMP-like [Nymphaea colorata]|nr:metalloendoproteinase 5-MMP-like [Nymphaea colorata]
MHPSPPFAALLLLCAALCFSATEAFGHGHGSQWWDEFHGLAGCQKGQNTSGLDALKRYFQHFGYLHDHANCSNEFDDDLEEAIRLYQHNFHLNVTGVLDTPTVQELIKPRCGVKDLVNGTSPSGRYVAKIGHSVAHFSFFQNSPRWTKNTLSYAFSTENQAFQRAQLQAVFSSAFARWSAVSSFNFVETTDLQSADIKIRFARGNHGDGAANAFTGKLGTLAHAFAPEVGMCHFDADETWAIDAAGLSTINSFDLESVAVHEIGHLLGLDHSTVPNAIMYPKIPQRTRKVNLDADDIQGIRALYAQGP